MLFEHKIYLKNLCFYAFFIEARIFQIYELSNLKLKTTNLIQQIRWQHILQNYLGLSFAGLSTKLLVFNGCSRIFAAVNDKGPRRSNKVQTKC